MPHTGLQGALQHHAAVSELGTPLGLCYVNFPLSLRLVASEIAEGTCHQA